MSHLRETLWERLATTRPWDLVVIGGGITGAGVAHAAARCGLRVALLEARDFAWGASSRSGKLVHGGLRYLRQARVGLVRSSLREREALLHEARGLVEPVPFVLPVYRTRHRWTLGLGLALYDALVGRRTFRWLEAPDLLERVPHLRRDGLQGGFLYHEALTDDARLVLRLVFEALEHGAVALNYAEVCDLLRLRDGRVAGVAVRDRVTGRTLEVPARVVINATGPWADRVRGWLPAPARMRPLRGIHLLFPHERFPLSQAVGFFHPQDRRPLYALPWMGHTLVGTTDVDHDQALDREPQPTPAEVDYLMAALQHTFPQLALRAEDATAAFAGVRPVVRHGHALPSQEPREHVVWREDGLVTVTGGKLTTFRLLARDALRAAFRALGRSRGPSRPLASTLQVPLEARHEMPRRVWTRWVGRYGAQAARLAERAAQSPEALAPVSNTPFLWVEVLWALEHELVVRLEDLLLRRTRVGLLLPDGGESLLPRLRTWCRRLLGWSEERWEREVRRYRQVLQEAYRWPRVARAARGVHAKVVERSRDEAGLFEKRVP